MSEKRKSMEEKWPREAGPEVRLDFVASPEVAALLAPSPEPVSRVEGVRVTVSGMLPAGTVAVVSIDPLALRYERHEALIAEHYRPAPYRAALAAELQGTVLLRHAFPDFGPLAIAPPSFQPPPVSRFDEPEWAFRLVERLLGYLTACEWSGERAQRRRDLNP